MKTTRRVSTLVAVSLVAALLVVAPARAAGGGNSLNAKSCQKGGWTGLVTTTGARFANEDACVSYGAKGGVLKRPQTVSFTSTNPSPANAGGTYTPTASATSGLPVTISVDPASSSVCSKSGAVVTFNAAGTCTINADQAGNATYDPAAQVQQSITLVRQTQAISFTSTNPSPVDVGDTYTPTASSTSELPVTISVDPASSSVCSLSGTLVTFDAAGTCTINADQAGNATYDPAAQVQQSITVNVPVITSQALCESQGGTFSTATSLWTCNDLPPGASADWSPMINHCIADGGAAAQAVGIASGWRFTCLGATLYALLLAVGGAVAGVLWAAFHGDDLPLP